MNKKLLTLILPIILGVMLVAAISYYAMITITLNINQPIEVTGNLEQTIDCDAGETCLGSEITVSNEGDESKTIVITDDNTNEDIEVSYVGELVLTEKTVDFTKDVWEIPEGADEVTVEYTLVGDEFNARVTEPIEGYVLIYYADNPDRFNNVAKAIDVDEIEENLPYFDDENAEEGQYDYCSTGEYSTCHGAKLWYVPETAVDEEGNINWGQATTFYYETFLIQYNSEGNIIVYPESSVTFKPLFEISEYAEDSSPVVNIEIA